MHVVYIGLGSNLGDREANLARAVRKVELSGRFLVEKVSSFYETAPVGGPPQGDYINAVMKAETDLSPAECLAFFKDIENGMGRASRGKDHPRIIDLDLLMFDGISMDTEELTVPHPRMHEREFVLKGMAEIAPEALHPALGKTMGELYGCG